MFVNIDRGLKLRLKLLPLSWLTTISNYAKYFQKIVLELNGQALGKSALTFFFLVVMYPVYGASHFFYTVNPIIN